MNGDIVVVENERVSRDRIAQVLRSAGFEVREASGVHEALSLVSQRLPDAAVVDWRLPDGTGFDLLRAFRTERLTRSIMTLVLGTCSSDDERILALESGADDYVTLPFSPKELVARVRAMLRRAVG